MSEAKHLKLDPPVDYENPLWPPRRLEPAHRAETLHEEMVRVLRTERLPPRYGFCSCMCHSMPGMKHIAACCGPEDIVAGDPIWRN
jgi:hypothetical protein